MEYAGKECLFISLFQRIIEVYMKSGCPEEVYRLWKGGKNATSSVGHRSLLARTERRRHKKKALGHAGQAGTPKPFIGWTGTVG